jgi:ferric-dicitrate binding protein FerR (iron transport regulator)
MSEHDDDDGELLARLRQLDARPARPPERWDALAAAVRTAYAAAHAPIERAERRPRRRRVWVSFSASALALAAALVLWLRPRPLPDATVAPNVPAEELGAFGGEVSIGEQLEELDDAAALERLDQALKQGA